MKKEFYRGDSFWSDDSEYKRIDYPINDEIIKQAEAILGVKLPSSLLDLMKIRNGGGLNYPYFMLPDGDTESIPYGGRARISDIDPIHFEKEDISILSSKELLKEVSLTGEFVVLWTDFHYWVVLNYRNRSQNPAVMYCISQKTSQLQRTTL
ncbi:SMI1/KNR4 family protein [Priestia megaterium]|uniref:SMI1/KNR4 family protein n=1 Tax=Priestia megaterium TaxID=1404 RepID=UPI003D96974D